MPERRTSREQPPPELLQQQVLDAVGSSIVVTDPNLEDNPIVYVNLAFERTTGYSCEEVVGNNCRFMQGNDMDQPALDGLRQTLGEGRDWSGVLRNYRKDGELLYNELSISPVRDGDGHLTHFIGVQRDVTERVKAEQERRESEEMLRSVLVGYCSDIITILDAEGYVTYESPALERALGKKPEEHIGRRGLDLIHPEDVERASEEFAAVMEEGGVSRPVEYRMQHADGGWRYFEGIANNLLEEAGIEGVVVNSRDITRRKRAEEELRESEERFRSLSEATFEGIAITSGSEILETNASLDSMFGYEPEEVVGMHTADFFTPESREVVQQRMASGSEEPYEVVGVRKDGTTFDVEILGRMLSYRGHEARVAAVRDITERKRAEEELRRQSTAMETSIDGMAILDRDGIYTYLNEAHAEIYGCESPQELLGESWRKLYSEEQLARIEQHVMPTLGTKGYWRGELFGLSKDGTEFPQEVSLITLEDGGLVCMVRDITERKAMEERLEHQALHDPLTDLPNRHLFTDRLGRALARAKRGGEPVAVLFLDIDNFKLVNDSMGHGAGDRLLCLIAGRLRENLRPSDTVARIGGEEFAVLLEGPGGREGASLVAERMLRELRAPFSLGGHEVLLTASSGISLGGHDEEAEDLLRQADIAMYRAKNVGKDDYEIFDPATMELPSLGRMELAGDLRRAIEREELKAYYQPKVEISSGRIAGWEALLRWEHPVHGFIPPDRFIPLAEESGLIVPIGRWVIREACRQAELWRQRHPSEPPPSVSVNLSPRQFRHQRLGEEVAAILEETGLPPQALELEITESTLMEDEESGFARMGESKDLGVRFALDDFGTGYSSLSVLRRLPIDSLKIDKSFVGGIEEDPKNEVLVSTMVNLARALGMGVVAEGMETHGELARLREMGAHFAQGYYFARPMPAERVFW